MQRETRIIDRHVSRNGSEPEGPSEARGGVVCQRILVLRGCQGRYRERFSGGRSGIGERHVFRHVDRSRVQVRCFAWGHARAGHVFRAHDPGWPEGPQGKRGNGAPDPRRFAGALNRRAWADFLLYQNAYGISPAAVGYVFVMDITITDKLLEGSEFVLLPVWIVEIFIKNDHCSGNDLLLQESQHCFCRRVQI